ncbi:MAG TPA: glycosyltransferase [Candidatus Latescibacteria bacterium]|nr:glycosyltransferase [Candidatus Latescibacterota bacterium]
MRILHVDSARTWRGGENQVLLLSSGLQERGHKVSIACPPGSVLARRAADAGIDTKRLPMRGELDLMACVRLARMIKKGGFEVLHLHTAHAHSLGLIASKLVRIPALVVSRRVDFHIGGNPASRLKYNSRVDRIIAISEGVRKVLIQDGVPPERIVVVHSGIDLKRFGNLDNSRSLYRDLGLSGREKLVGIVAALAPHKDHVNFLNASQIVAGVRPDTRFLIVGEGEGKEGLKGLVKKLDLEGYVIFTGFRNDIPKVLSTLDVFVLSSYLEGLCTSILEAMAAGLPVVATSTGGVPELVKDGDNGILVPPQNPKALAEGILRILNNPSLAMRLGRAGKDFALNFSADKMVEDTETIYRSILQSVR